MGSKGAECATCHMPVRRYMVIDPRHDHSMRIPRPDRAARNGCAGSLHRDAIAIASPHGRRPRSSAGRATEPEGFQRFADAFHADDRRDSSAASRLRAVASDRTQSAIARASAVERLAQWPAPATNETLVAALNDDDPLVRAAATRAFQQADATNAVAALAYRLRDPVREVRMGAARVLAGAHERNLSERDRAAFSAALDELVTALRFDADRPEARTNLGTLFAARGQWQSAIPELRRALELDPGYVPATVNLADVLRGSGDDQAAEEVLREGMRHSPGVASLHHALGLALVRQQRKADALVELRRASELDPADTRFGYVYAVALQDGGQAAQAIRVLEQIIARDPQDRAVLEALVEFEKARGNAAKAATWTATLQVVG